MKPTRLTWFTGTGLIVAWVIMGVFFARSNVEWLARLGIAAATICPLAFVLLYTVLGLSGGAKWWRTDVGTNIVWLEVAAICSSAILAWTFLFNHGMLTNPYLAWAYTGGLLAGALIITWRSVIWLRADRYARQHQHGKQ